MNVLSYSGSAITTGNVAIQDIPDYFCVSPSSTVLSIKWTGLPTGHNISYCGDLSTNIWTAVSNNTTITVYGSVYFKTTNTTQKSLEGSKLVYVSQDDLSLSGNIMSLVTANFASVTSITNDYEFAGLFANNTHITDISTLKLPATTLSNYCYDSMFYGCSHLINRSGASPALPAITMTAGCYREMFAYSGLVTPPELPATTLSSNCYKSMFEASSINTTPAILPASVAYDGCYQDMFKNCQYLFHSNLKICATEVYSFSLCGMFEGCVFLESYDNEININGTDSYGYSTYQLADMFKGCTNLKWVNKININTSNVNISGMFYNCLCLTNASISLGDSVSNIVADNLFYGCSSLSTLYIYGYAYQFSSYSSATSGVASTGTLYTKSASTTFPAPSGWSKQWIDGLLAPQVTAGQECMDIYNPNNESCDAYYVDDVYATQTFLATVPAQGTSYDISVPAGTYYVYFSMNADERTSEAVTVTVTEDPNFKITPTTTNTTRITFTNVGAKSTAITIYGKLQNASSYSSIGSLSSSGASCYIDVPNGMSLKLYANFGSNTFSATSYVQISANNGIDISGNLSSLLNNGNSSYTLHGYDFCSLFSGCSNLRNINCNFLVNPSGGNYLYKEMFYECYGIQNCYTPIYVGSCTYACSNMFERCNGNFYTTPTLPSTTLTEGCYYHMFESALSHESNPISLPATTAATSCYEGMFMYAGIQTPSSMSLTTLASTCCQDMYYWSEITTMLSSLPVPSAEGCYRRMFYQCPYLQPTSTIIWSTLTNAPAYCCHQMFFDCYAMSLMPISIGTSLTSPSTIGMYAFDSMYLDCAGMNTTYVQSFGPNTSVSTNAFSRMFESCIALRTCPVNNLPLPNYDSFNAYASMFKNCYNLTSLPYITLPNEYYTQGFASCYSHIFENVTGDVTLNIGGYYWCDGASQISSIPTYEWVAGAGMSTIRCNSILPVIKDSSHLLSSAYIQWTDGLLLATSDIVPDYTQATETYVPVSFTNRNNVDVNVYISNSGGDGKENFTFIGTVDANNTVSFDVPYASTLYVRYYNVTTETRRSGNPNSLSLDACIALNEPPFFISANAGSVITFSVEDYTEYYGGTLTNQYKVLYSSKADGPWTETDSIENCGDTFTITVPSGGYVYFKGVSDSKTYNNAEAEIHIDVNDRFSIGGCIASLFKSSNYSLSSISTYQYYYLFCNSRCVSAQCIISQSIASGNGYMCAHMFDGCSQLASVGSITNPMKLYIAQNTTQQSNHMDAYECMFANCINLYTPYIELCPVSSGASMYFGMYECAQMFEYCSSMILAPTVGAHASIYAQIASFNSMFNGCSSLTSGMIISSPAGSLYDSECTFMYRNCSNLTTAYLPVQGPIISTIPDYCFRDAFSGCTKLTSVGFYGVTAYSLGYMACCGAFNGCSSLINAPFTYIGNTYNSTSATLSSYACKWMYKGCTHLTSDVQVYASSVSAYGCQSMFENCTSLTTANIYLTSDCVKGIYAFAGMYKGCSGITGYSYYDTYSTAFNTAPGNYASVFQEMFMNCTSLPKSLYIEMASASTTTGNYVYKSMYEGCTSLQQGCLPKNLTSATGIGAFQRMYYGCSLMYTSRTDAGTGTADRIVAYTYNVGTYTYNQTFMGCSNLRYARVLCNYTTIPPYNFAYMFANCTSLTDTEFKDSAGSSYQGFTAVSTYGCDHMYSGCTSFTNSTYMYIINLNNVTSIGNYGCQRMCEKCAFTTIGSTSALAPKATSVGVYGMEGMFYQCGSLTTAYVNYSGTISSNTTPAKMAFAYMFYQCASMTALHMKASSWSYNSSTSSPTYNWVDGVTKTGTFYYPSGKSYPSTTGSSAIPSNFTKTAE